MKAFLIEYSSLAGNFSRVVVAADVGAAISIFRSKKYGVDEIAKIECLGIAVMETVPDLMEGSYPKGVIVDDLQNVGADPAHPPPGQPGFNDSAGFNDSRYPGWSGDEGTISLHGRPVFQIYRKGYQDVCCSDLNEFTRRVAFALNQMKIEIPLLK